MIERVLVFQHDDTFAFELDPSMLVSAYITEQVNGEHSLDVVTVQRLSAGQRVLLSDAAGTWHEYVVTGTDELHDAGVTAIGTYHAVWSVQYDLSAVHGEYRYPGEDDDPVSASIALADALAGTSRWKRGTVNVTTTGSVEMFKESAWQRVGMVVDEFGGEVRADITVGQNKVTGRKISLLTRIGSSTVTRRFDWGADVTRIRRRPPDGPMYCRVLPMGEEDITIESVNGGKDYIEDAQAAAAYKVPDGSGGWEYPTIIIENTEIDDEQDLKDWAQSVLHDYTRPVPTYEADVLQFAEAGMDVRGVAIGDTVHIVDTGFDGSTPLRLEGRVLKMTTNLMCPSDTELTIGQLGKTVASTFRALESQLNATRSKLDIMYTASGSAATTADYLHWLIGQVNQQVNATGGWAYIVEGGGIRTYDVEVSDPAVGSEASKAVEIKGGSVRIADSKTAQGEWDWKTVIMAGQLVVGDYVTSQHIYTGFIGSPSGNYWNLDTGELRMMSTAMVGNQTIQEYTDSRAQAKADSAVAAAVADIDADIENLQDQIDGAIETWFYSGTPTLSNQPANAWTTDDEKNNHLGDLYYDSATGKAYRFQLEGSTYKWQAIADSDIAKALSLSGEKKRIFYAAASSHPNPPYDVNDLWVQGGNGDIFRCKTAKASGASYSSSDWEKASKYTDDTAVTNLNSTLMQDQIYDRLFPVNPTTRKRQEGMIIKNGYLYMNASYITSGTLNANLLRAGVIKDKKGVSMWDLDAGTFRTTSATLKGKVTSGNDTKSVVLENGTFAGYAKNKYTGNVKKRTGYIDGTAVTQMVKWNKKKGKYVPVKPAKFRYGLKIRGEQVVRIETPAIAVLNDMRKKDPATKEAPVAHTTFTGTLKLTGITCDWKYTSKKFIWNTANVRLKFINGMLVECSGWE